MISIGDFIFPERLTVSQVSVIEAKSKVRKEIRIHSMLKDSLEDLQSAVEAFDRGEASLSLNPGRFYRGRRRRFDVTPNLPSSLAWVEFHVFTNDRYERSAALHTHSMDTALGQAAFALQNQGNWQSPLYFTLTPLQPIERVDIDFAGETFVFQEDVPEDIAIEIDTENRLVTIDGQNHFASAEEPFPVLPAGTNSIVVRVQPAESTVHCSVQYRDYWV